MKTQLLEMMNTVHSIAKANDLEYMLAYGSLIGAVREKGMIPWDTEFDIWVKQDIYEEFVDVLRKNLPETLEIRSNKDKDYELFFARVFLKGVFHDDAHIDIFPLVGAPSSETEIRKFVNKSYFLNKIYYVKKLDPVVFYLNTKRYKRFVQSILIKLILLPIPIGIIKKKLFGLSTTYNINEAKNLYTFGGSYKLREVFPSGYFEGIIETIFDDYYFMIPQNFDSILKQVYGEYMKPQKEDYLNKEY